MFCGHRVSESLFIFENVVYFQIMNKGEPVQVEIYIFDDYQTLVSSMIKDTQAKTVESFQWTWDCENWASVFSNDTV